VLCYVQPLFTVTCSHIRAVLTVECWFRFRFSFCVKGFCCCRLSHCQSLRVHRMNLDLAPDGCHPLDQETNSGCESTSRLLQSTLPLLFIITKPQSWYFIPQSAVNLYSPCPRLCVCCSAVHNFAMVGFKSGSSHTAVMHTATRSLWPAIRT